MVTSGNFNGTDEESLVLILNPADKSSPPANNRHPFTQWTASQLRETSLCFIFATLGWHLPKLFFFPTESQISSRPVPFMTLASSGEILLEARYNYEVADPPMVGSSFLIFTGVYLPLIIITLVEFACRRHPRFIFNTFFSALGLSEGATQILKFWVRRPRPNYYHLCAFSFDTRQCTAPFVKIVEAQLSFPSGHTSLSFCTMTVLALWMFQKCRDRQQQQQQQQRNNGSYKLSMFLSALLPWGWATFVGVSRIVDHWHHPSDVVAGCMLGSACATLCFVVHNDATSTTTSSSSSSNKTLATAPSMMTMTTLSTKESLE